MTNIVPDTGRTTSVESNSKPLLCSLAVLALVGSEATRLAEIIKVLGDINDLPEYAVRAAVKRLVEAGIVKESRGTNRKDGISLTLLTDHQTATAKIEAHLNRSGVRRPAALVSKKTAVLPPAPPVAFSQADTITMTMDNVPTLFIEEKRVNAAIASLRSHADELRAAATKSAAALADALEELETLRASKAANQLEVVGTEMLGTFMVMKLNKEKNGSGKELTVLHLVSDDLYDALSVRLEVA